MWIVNAYGSANCHRCLNDQFLFENDGYKGFYEKQSKYVPTAQTQVLCSWHPRN